MKETNKVLNRLINFSEKILQDNALDNNQYESLCNICTINLDETKMNLS